MAITPIRSTSIPDLSSYLRLQNEANKNITNSFNQLAQAGNSYNKVQSEAYNNPLLDRLKRSNSLEDFNAIDSSIDPSKANAAVKALQYGKIKEYNGIENQIADSKLLNQININDPNAITQAQRLQQGTEPRTQKLLQDIISKRTSIDNNLSKLKTDASVVRDAQESFNNGTLPNFVADSATNSEQFNAINNLLNRQQGTKLSNKNTLESNDINTAIGNKDLQTLYNVRDSITNNSNSNNPIDAKDLARVTQAIQQIETFNRLTGKPVTPTNGSLETQQKRLNANEFVNILDTDEAQAQQIASIGVRPPISEDVVITQEFMDDPANFDNITGTTPSIAQIVSENPDLNIGADPETVINNQNEIINNPLLGLNETPVNESSTLQLEVPSKLQQKINENRIKAYSKASTEPDPIKASSIITGLKESTEKATHKGYAQSIADKSTNSDDVEFFLNNSPEVQNLPKIDKDSIRNQATELMKGRPVTPNRISEYIKRIETDNNTKYSQVQNAIAPTARIQKFRSFKKVENELSSLDDTSMTNRTLEILNEGKTTNKGLLGGEVLSPQLLNTLYNDVKNEISSNPAIKNASRSQIYSSIINTAENVEGSIFNTLNLYTPFTSDVNIYDTTVTDVDNIVDDLIANTSVSEEANKTIRDEKKLSNTENEVKALKVESEKAINDLKLLERLKASPKELEKQKKKVTKNTNAFTKYINSTKSNSNTNINIVEKNSIPGKINTSPPLSKEDQIKDINLIKNNRLIDLLRQQDSRANR